jgi:polyphenol oxidase
MTIDVVRSSVLPAFKHGFLGRSGGVSEGLYASLNVGLGSQDDPAKIAENRARAVNAILPHATLVTVHQVHSPTCITITAPWPDDQRPEADAMVTGQRGLALGVLTADCAPVLLGDARAKVIGAAHAGWKGALNGVIEATVDAMVALGASRGRISAAIGPCIGLHSYEVDQGFLDGFTRADPHNDRFFKPNRSPGRYQFDLPSFVIHRLRRAGVATIDAVREDTYSQPTRYFSYRRTTHAREADYGRQLSAIALS